MNPHLGAESVIEARVRLQRERQQREGAKRLSAADVFRMKLNR